MRKALALILVSVTVSCVAQYTTIPGNGYYTGSNRFSKMVGIGDTTTIASAILNVKSTTKGVLLPRMTTAQMLSISSPANSLLIFNTDSSKFYYYKTTGATWVQLNSSTLVSGNGTTINGDSIDFGGTINKHTPIFLQNYSFGIIGDGVTFALGNIEQGGGEVGYDSSVIIEAKKNVVFQGNDQCLIQSQNNDVKITAGDSIIADAGSGVFVMHNSVIPGADNHDDLGGSNDRWARNYTVIRVQEDTVFVPSTGDTVSVRAGYYSIIKPASGLLTLKIDLPSSIQNGYTIELKFTQTITTLSYINGTVGGSALTSISLANPYQKLVYNSSTGTWY